MTSIAYDPRELPDGYDRADSQFQVADRLRPFYRRSAQLDRDRITAFRRDRGTAEFEVAENLWPPGGGLAPRVQAAASAGPRAADLLAHYCALKDADDQYRAQAKAQAADATRRAQTCSCCGTTDASTRCRGGSLDTLEPTPFGGPRICEPCAQVLRRIARSRIDAAADRAALEDTPNGGRGEACARWLAAAAGEDR